MRGTDQYRAYVDHKGREVRVRPAGVSGFCAWADSGPERIGHAIGRTRWVAVGAFGHTVFQAQRALDAEAYRRCWDPLP